ncbi:hypothetical protein CORC01_10824 [Colletotrichum orchidophilum]|uniref:Uncharacterized protein n=1 Tax=Colletotrichum orchidophilum TaxID=1209926 RepID=A0A1G4AXT3_9PEZI|nr:uncharacterized protein CORC01_10824 [Colletotrichum orchidophilum]OHE93925.1 hypothetical protein CORC01_10824 [Colletotrichum orchidophilum]
MAILSQSQHSRASPHSSPILSGAVIGKAPSGRPICGSEAGLDVASLESGINFMNCPSTMRGRRSPTRAGPSSFPDCHGARTQFLTSDKAPSITRGVRDALLTIECNIKLAPSGCTVQGQQCSWVFRLVTYDDAIFAPRAMDIDPARAVNAMLVSVDAGPLSDTEKAACTGGNRWQVDGRSAIGSFHGRKSTHGGRRMRSWQDVALDVAAQDMKSRDAALIGRPRGSTHILNAGRAGDAKTLDEHPTYFTQPDLDAPHKLRVTLQRGPSAIACHSLRLAETAPNLVRRACPDSGSAQNAQSRAPVIRRKPLVFYPRSRRTSSGDATSPLHAFVLSPSHTKKGFEDVDVITMRRLLIYAGL